MTTIECAPSPSRSADDSDDGDSSSDGGSSRGPSTKFTLDGTTWTFENPVVLVLAAARQLGMAIGRDARMLWIADEALLDEYDEDDPQFKSKTDQWLQYILHKLHALLWIVIATGIAIHTELFELIVDGHPPSRPAAELNRCALLFFCCAFFAVATADCHTAMTHKFRVRAQPTAGLRGATLGKTTGGNFSMTDS